MKYLNVNSCTSENSPHCYEQDPRLKSAPFNLGFALI